MIFTQLKNKRGIKLVEMMMCVLLLSFILAALHTTLITGRRSWDRNSSMLISQQSVRNAMNIMSKDLRVASGVSVTQNASSATITFTEPDLGTITYAWTISGASAKRIIRTLSTGSKIIANNITAFSITDAVNDTTIALTASTTAANGGTVTFSSSKKVAKR